MSDNNQTEWQEITLRVPKSIDLSNYSHAEIAEPSNGDTALIAGKLCKLVSSRGELQVILVRKPPPYQWPLLADGTPIGGWGFEAVDSPDGHKVYLNLGDGYCLNETCLQKLNIKLPTREQCPVMNPHYQAKGGE